MSRSQRIRHRAAGFPWDGAPAALITHLCIDFSCADHGLRVLLEIYTHGLGNPLGNIGVVIDTAKELCSCSVGSQGQHRTTVIA